MENINYETISKVITFVDAHGTITALVVAFLSPIVKYVFGKIKEELQYYMVPIKKDCENQWSQLGISLNSLIGLISVLGQILILNLQMKWCDQDSVHLVVLLFYTMIVISIGIVPLFVIKKINKIMEIWIWIDLVLFFNFWVLFFIDVMKLNANISLLGAVMPLLWVMGVGGYREHNEIKGRREEIKIVWGAIYVIQFFVLCAVVYRSFGDMSNIEMTAFTACIILCMWGDWIVLDFWEPELIPITVNVMTNKQKKSFIAISAIK